MQQLCCEWYGKLWLMIAADEERLSASKMRYTKNPLTERLDNLLDLSKHSFYALLCSMFNGISHDELRWSSSSSQVEWIMQLRKKHSNNRRERVEE